MGLIAVLGLALCCFYAGVRLGPVWHADARRVLRRLRGHGEPGAGGSRRVVGALIGLLAIAWWLRALGPSLHGFDPGRGSIVNADEVTIGDGIGGLVPNLHYPTSLADFLRPDSHWNPAVAASWWAAPSAGHALHDPAGFAYGSLPLYLTKLFASLLAWLGAHFGLFATWQHASPVLAGRVLSGLCGAATVYLVFCLARRLAGSRTALFAAALATFAVLSIQVAHLSTNEAFLALCTTGTVLASVGFAQRGTCRAIAVAGVWLAAALATSIFAAPLVLTVGAAVIWRWLSDRRWQARASVLGQVCLAALTWLCASFVFQPYAFLDSGTFSAAVRAQLDTAGGAQISGSALVWHDTAALMFPAQQLARFGLGVPLALLAAAGLVFASVCLFWPARRAAGLVAWFVLSDFLVIGDLYVKDVRLLEPIVPALCVLAALPVGALAGHGGRLVHAAGVLGGGAVLLLTTAYGLAYTHISSVPPTRVQASDWICAHVPVGTRIFDDAQDFQLPLGCSNGRTYTSLDVPGLWSETYSDDSQSKVAQLAAPLAEAAYFISSSGRPAATAAADPQRFPYSIRFYALMLGGKAGRENGLGYSTVATFAVHPELGPWVDDERNVHETATEPDHPTVMVLANTGRLSAAAIAEVLTDHGRIGDPTNPVEQVARPAKSLLLTASELRSDQHGQTYAAMFPANGLPMRFPIPAWWLMVEVLGLLALPISMRLFSRLGDCGFAMSKTVGILLLSWCAWILPSMHWADYSRAEIALCLLPVAALSLGWGVRLRDIPCILRPRLVAVVLSEGAFIVGYLFFVWLRAIYPDFGHSFDIGEKTMDFSFLNAIVRSSTLPPLDPWFSGGYLNYYYYGHFTVATLLKLAGIAPTIAINLAMPTFFALTLASCISLAYSLIRRIPFALLSGSLALLAGNMYGGQVMIGDLQAASPLQSQLHPPSAAGSSVPVVGPVIDLLSYSWSVLAGLVQGAWAALLGLGQVFLGHQGLPWYPFRSWAWDGSRFDGGVITEFPYWTFLYGDPHAHLWDMPFALCIVGMACTFLHGTMGTVACPLAEGRAVSEVDESPSLLPGLRLIVWPVIGVVLGALGPTNTWDLAGAFGILGLAIAAWSFRTGAGWLRTGWATGWRLGVLVVLALGGLKPIIPFGLYRPFYDHFFSFYDRYGWTILRHQTPLHDFATYWGLPLYILTAYLLVCFWQDTNLARRLRHDCRVAAFRCYYWERRADLPRYFALARRRVPPEPEPGSSPSRSGDRAVIFLAAMAASLLFAHAGLIVLAGLALLAAAALLARGPVWTTCLLGAGGAAGLLVIDYLVLAWLSGLIGLAVLLLIDRADEHDDREVFLHLLIIMGLLIAAAAEIIYVVDFNDADPLLFRSNTVFKLYEDAWLLLSICAGVGLARLLAPFLMRFRWGRPRAPRVQHALPASSRPGLVGWAWVGGLVLLLSAAALYPLRMTPERLDERTTAWPALASAHIGLTLDSLAFMPAVYPDDYAAIEWFNQTVRGSPVVLQSDHGFFTNMSARITMYTGLPSVVNWNFEVGQQHYSGQKAANGSWYPDEVGARARDVDLIYSTPNAQVALNLLHRYQVTYICVGSQERGDPNLAGDAGNFHGYPADGLAKFARMVGLHELALVFTHGSMQVYRVLV